MALRPLIDPITAYARAVTAGKAVAGRLVRLACTRHLRDLETGHERGLAWDAEAAGRVIAFFGFLRLPDADKPFKLEPWQCFIVGSLFGWKGEDGSRRFRTAYVEAGKGCGKSPLAAGIGLYGLVADGEQAAEVYSAATTADQANILFRDAKNLVDASPSLKKRLDVGQHNIAHLPSKSFFRPVSSEHRQLDGKRVHMALVDEIHEHPTGLVVDKLRAGTKGRKQALIFEITNSGHDKETVCWAHHEYSEKVLDGRLQDDSWFAYICTLDPCQEHAEEGKVQPVEGCAKCDDWRDEATWEKVNPNLGVSIQAKYLREQVREAEGMPTKEGIVRRLNFCHWTQAHTAWLPAALWAKGKTPPIDAAVLKGAICCGGLDVASKIDLAAFVLCFPGWPEEGHYGLLPQFWIPEATAESRQQKDGIPWRVWERMGLVTFCRGETISQDMIEDTVRQAHADYCLADVAFDPWNASQLATHLIEDGIEMVEFTQSLRNYTEPSKEFEKLLKEGRLHHGGHLVLDWNASNVAVLTDNSGNIRPLKPDHNSPKKVDGICASVMALARAMLQSGGWGGSLLS